MNEAERCDRISLMNAGKVLAQGAPEDLVRSRHTNNLEQAFISVLEEATGAGPGGGEPERELVTSEPPSVREQVHSGWFSLTRLWAYARRETTDRRDRRLVSFRQTS